MKKIIFIVLIVHSLNSNAQVSLTYFPFESVLSIGTNTEKLLMTDLRFETNTFFTNINSQVDLNCNFKRTELANYYAGVGLNFSPFYSINDLPFTNGYALILGSRIKPFKNKRNVQIVFELSPYINKYFDGGILKTNLGVSYNFD